MVLVEQITLKSKNYNFKYTKYFFIFVFIWSQSNKHIHKYAINVADGSNTMRASASLVKNYYFIILNEFSIYIISIILDLKLNRKGGSGNETIDSITWFISLSDTEILMRKTKKKSCLCKKCVFFPVLSYSYYFLRSHYFLQ